MFDSPFQICPVCNEPVLLDQTLRECAGEHGCGDGQGCPLARCFSGHDFSVQPEMRNEHEQTPRSS